MAALAHRTSQERLWLVGGGVGAVVVALIGWLLFISPQRSETSDVDAQAQDVRLQNVALQGRISSLQKQWDHMSGVKGALAAAEQALPSTSGVPAFLRTLQSLGSTTGTDVVTLTVGAPVDVTSVALGSVPNPAASSAPSASTGATGSTGSAAPGSPGTGVYGLTISAQVNGSPDQLNRFLEKLQAKQPRAVLITQISEGSADQDSGGSTSLQLTMQAFVAPSSSAEKSQLSQASSR